MKLHTLWKHPTSISYLHELRSPKFIPIGIGMPSWIPNFGWNSKLNRDSNWNSKLNSWSVGRVYFIPPSVSSCLSLRRHNIEISMESVFDLETLTLTNDLDLQTWFGYRSSWLQCQTSGMYICLFSCLCDTHWHANTKTSLKSVFRSQIIVICILHSSINSSGWFHNSMYRDHNCQIAFW